MLNKKQISNIKEINPRKQWEKPKSEAYAAKVHTIDGKNILEVCLFKDLNPQYRWFFNKKKQWITYDVTKNSTTINKVLKTYNKDWSDYYCSSTTKEIIDNFFKNKEYPKGLSYITSFMNHVIEEKKEKREDAIKSKYLTLFYKQIPKGLDDFINDNIKKECFLFFWRERGIKTDSLILNDSYFCHCSHCGKEYEITSYAPSHNEIRYCEECGMKGILKARGISRNKLRYSDNIAFFQNKGKYLLLRCFHVSRNYTQSYGFTKYKEYARYVFYNGIAKMFCNERKTGMGNQIYCINDFELRKKVEIFDTQFILFGDLKHSLRGSFLEKQAEIINEAYNKPHQCLVTILKNMSLYSSIEYIYKFGLKKIAYAILLRGQDKSFKSIKLTGKTAEEVIGMSINILKTYDLENLTESILYLLKEMGCPKASVANNIIKNLTEKFAYMDYINLKNIITYNTNLTKLLNYISKQDYKSMSLALSDYKDYLMECNTLQLEMSETVLYPKDLLAAHARTTIQCKYKADAELEENFAKAVKKWSRKTFTHGDMFIAPVKSAEELILESKKFNNCAGGYCDRIAEGSSVIFIIKKNNLPDPFYMLELDPKRKVVIQCRGKAEGVLGQVSATEEVQKFVDLWMKKK